MNSRRAFTLIDLMVAVAILGILVALSIPQVRKFQARGRQTAAKTELTSIFALQAAFRQEFKTYSSDLYGLGYRPAGLSYVVSFPVYYPRMSNRGRFYGITPGSEVATVPTDWSTLGISHTPYYTMDYPAHLSRCEVISNENSLTPVNAIESTMAAPRAFVSKTTFQISALGCPVVNLTSTARLDRWSITHESVIKQLNDGMSGF